MLLLPSSGFLFFKGTRIVVGALFLVIFELYEWWVCIKRISLVLKRHKIYRNQMGLVCAPRPGRTAARCPKDDVWSLGACEEW